MAISATTLWRARPSGNDANGAAYDPAQSGALATTLTAAISAGDTTIGVASATGWPASGNYYAQIGDAGAEGASGSSEIVLVTGGQGTTSWTVTRAQLGTAALAFAAGVTVDNNLTRCDTAPFSGSAGTSSASTTFTDASGGFNETVVGLYLRIASGTGATTGYYRITGYTNSTTITLDRTSGTYTNAAWKIGGAADTIKRIYDSANATGDKPVAGNKIYLRGDGSENPSSTHYTETGGWWSPPSGDTTSGYISLIGEYGRPRIEYGNSLWFYGAFLAYTRLHRLYFFANATTGSQPFREDGALTFFGCCFNGNDRNARTLSSASGLTVLFCEFFSKASAPTANANATAIHGAAWFSMLVAYNHIHHMGGAGLEIGNSWGWAVFGNVIAHCKGSAIVVNIGGSYAYARLIAANTIDANEGHGIDLQGTNELLSLVIANNIISNHNQTSKVGLKIAGTTALNDDWALGRVMNNAFYNNTSHRSNISAQTGDVDDVDPQYVSAATGDYRIGSALKALGFPTGDWPGAPSGARTFLDIGALQRMERSPRAAFHLGM